MVTGHTRTTLPKHVARILLGAALIFAGTAHLTFARDDFQAQVPDFVPLDPDVTVLASGVVEVALGLALLIVRARRRTLGWVVAAFFVAVFPGNIAQFVHARDGFGLDSDTARFVRLLFQPLLVAWALWSTGVLWSTGALRRSTSRR